MAFERKIIEKVSCPRCNAWAELRIDQKKTDNKWILVYVVCETCKLNRYQYTITRKALKQKLRIAKLKNAAIKNPKRSRVLREHIEKIEKQSSGLDML